LKIVEFDAAVLPGIDYTEIDLGFQIFPGKKKELSGLKAAERERRETGAPRSQPIQHPGLFSDSP
jgi:hypothetical protein